MKISSPKGDPFPTPLEDPLFEPLPFNQAQVMLTREKVPKRSSEHPSPLPEGLNASKIGFSPVMTPHKYHRRPVTGASVWRTPRSPEYRSAEKRSLEVESPNHKCLYKYAKPEAKTRGAF